MKKTFRALLMALPFVALAAVRADEEGADMAVTPPSIGERGGHGPMSLLTPEERAQVKAAHDKAIADDPSLKQKMQAAREAFQEAREALQDAMIKVDPSLEPILAKLPKPGAGGKRAGKKEWCKGDSAGQAMNGSSGAEEGYKPRHKGPPGLANLSESERSQLMAAREKAKSDPAVIAAREARKKATTPEARRTAEEAMHKTMHDAMIKADPALGAILEKLRAGGRPPAPPSEE